MGKFNKNRKEGEFPKSFTYEYKVGARTNELKFSLAEIYRLYNIKRGNEIICIAEISKAGQVNDFILVTGKRECGLSKNLWEDIVQSAFKEAEEKIKIK